MWVIGVAWFGIVVVYAVALCRMAAPQTDAEQIEADEEQMRALLREARKGRRP